MGSPLSRRTSIQEKGPESFSAVVERMQERKPERKPERQPDRQPEAAQKDDPIKTSQKPGSGGNEVGSRISKDLSVKRKDAGPSQSATDADSDRNGMGDSTSEGGNESSSVAKPTGQSRNGLKVEHLGAGREKRSLSPRQKAMQEFMDSVESEFSIPPERLVEAMAKLNDKALLQTPEQSASQVIGELNLPAATSEKVEARYVKMLAKLSDLEGRRSEKMHEPTADQLAMMKLAGGLAGIGAMASIKRNIEKGEDAQDVIGSARDRRQLLNDSVEKLKDQFFTGSEIIAQAKMGEDYLSKADADPIAGLTAMMLAEKNGEAGGPGDPLTLQSLPGLKGALTTPMKSAVENYQDLSEKMATLGVTAGAITQSLKNDPVNREAMKMEAQQGFSSNAKVIGDGNAYSFLMSGAAVSSSGSAAADLDSFSEGNGGSSRENLDLTSGRMGGEFFAAKDANLGKSDFAVLAGVNGNVSVAKSADPSQNIQQLMSQAQYVIKKGGGDAIVKLNPEGLGEVHLRVTVNEGKVNLQMSAETKEAKNLIESSIKDLTSSLSSHNLKVEHIKVDVGNQASSDSGNLHNGSHFDQGREQARQFLSNFQDENLARRNHFFESPALKAYNPHKSPDPLKPSPEAVASRRYLGEGRGTGLNLVA